jgi:DNA-binding NarL/FixJ family response regulator
MIKLLIVDDHKMTRLSIRLFIEQDPDIQIIGEASDVEEGVALCSSLKPNIVLMDLNMPKMSGVEALKIMVSNKADAGIIVLTGCASKREIQDSLLAGAEGFCLKDSIDSHLIGAIKTVVSGEIWIDPILLNSIPGLIGLSMDRNNQILA